MITRRALFSKLAALPFVGAWLVGKASAFDDGMFPGLEIETTTEVACDVPMPPSWTNCGVVGTIADSKNGKQLVIPATSLSPDLLQSGEIAHGVMHCAIDSGFYCEIIGTDCRTSAHPLSVIEWIPVTERLPEYPKTDGGNGQTIVGWARVLVWSLDCGGRAFISHFSEGEWMISADAIASDVTHWAALPAPPVPPKPIGAPDYVVCRDGTVLSWG